MISLRFLFYLIIVSLGYFYGICIYYKKFLNIHGPDSNIIRNIKYRYKNKCYKLKPIIKTCK